MFDNDVFGQEGGLLARWPVAKKKAQMALSEPCLYIYNRRLVAQAIPSYCMSTFLLPNSLGDEIQNMLNSFWWGPNKNSGREIN